MNLHFKQANLFLVLALLLALFASCAGLRVGGVPFRLSANFNADATGVRPDANLPGDPEGDQIIYRGGIVNPQVIREGDNKWLSISNTRTGDLPVAADRMIFRGVSVTYPTNVYYFWKIKIVVPFANGTFTVNLTDGAGNDNVSLTLVDNQMIAGGDPHFGYLYLMPSRELLGRIPINQNCAFSLDIDHLTNTFSLSVSRPASEDGNLSIRNHPLLVNMSAGTKNPSIEIKNDTNPPEFQSGTTLVNSTTGILFLDDLRIQAN